MPLGDASGSAPGSATACPAATPSRSTSTSTSARACAAVYLELSEVNSNLAGILAPILLGAAASGYLASAGSGSLAAAPWLFRARHFVKGHGAVTAGSTAASAVAVTVAIAAITTGSPTKDTAADSGSFNDRVAVSPNADPSSPSQSDRTSGGPTTAGPTSASSNTDDPSDPGDRHDEGTGRASADRPGRLR